MADPHPKTTQCFSDETPWDIRKQILDYHATECMSDSERAAYFGLPAGCRMRERAKILSPEQLTIGENCWIGEGAILDASGNLSIGDNVSIGLGVYLWSHDSHRLNIRGTNTREHSSQIRRKPTKIGSNCFISGPSVVMPGVTIGDKCIIAPLSVIYEDLPARTIYEPYREFLSLRTETDRLNASLKQMDTRVAELTSRIADLSSRLE
jgi:acetyltransferase-like isoleucine patch superfamily enzyme